MLAARGYTVDPKTPTVVALRGLSNTGGAQYDDTIVVLNRDAKGKPVVTTLAGSTHPGQTTAPVGGAVGVPDVNGDGKADVGMIHPGEYRLVPHGNHAGATAREVQTGGLFAHEDFTEVHSQPQSYLREALAALEGSEVGPQEKIIIALSMQKLPLTEFVRFSEQVLAFLEAGLVPATVFEKAAFPTYDWNTTLVESFADPSVRRLLDLVLASPSVGDRRKEIVKDEILRGNTQKDVLELRAAGEIK